MLPENFYFVSSLNYGYIVAWIYCFMVRENKLQYSISITQVNNETMNQGHQNLTWNQRYIFQRYLRKGI